MLLGMTHRWQNRSGRLSLFSAGFEAPSAMGRGSLGMR
jgi:hypothetical protein